MQSAAKTPDEYIAELPDDRREAAEKLRKTILGNLPEGFEEAMSYGMVGYIVPHKLYPNGYHCDPKLPLPFFSFASQKNSLNIYHMGMYANQQLLDWFVSEYPKHVKTKLDMGKSCVRFKKPNEIPYELIAQLLQKMSVADWIALYEKALKQ